MPYSTSSEEPSPKRRKIDPATHENHRYTPVVKYTSQIPFWQGPSFSDITIRTKSKTYYLHRIFLIRSSYFQTLFTGNWSESKEEAIDLTEVESTIVASVFDNDCGEIEEQIWDALFQFIYSDWCECLNNFNIVQVMVLIHLFKFFDLNTQLIVNETRGLRRLCLLRFIEDKLGEIVSVQDKEDLVIDFVMTFAQLSETESHSEDQELLTTLYKLPTELMKYVITIPLIPLQYKAELLFFWIQSSLELDPKVDHSLRHLDNAKPYLEVADSLNLYGIGDMKAIRKLKIFSEKTLKKARKFRRSLLKERIKKKYLSSSEIVSESFYFSKKMQLYDHDNIHFSKKLILSIVGAERYVGQWFIDVENQYAIPFEYEVVIQYKNWLQDDCDNIAACCLQENIFHTQTTFRDKCDAKAPARYDHSKTIQTSERVDGVHIRGILLLRY